MTHASIQKFWKLEDVPELSLSPQDHLCEEHYLAMHSRDETGPKIIPLLDIRPSSPKEGSSDWKDDCHQTLFSKRSISNAPWKNADKFQDCRTTFCRIMEFSSTILQILTLAWSLTLLLRLLQIYLSMIFCNRGQNLQNDIIEVILCFRCHSIVFACDIIYILLATIASKVTQQTTEVA
ncbi:hypothetical protein J437_LFUL019170 [Ladona fulva]|uniref:Uncharacterized protein n=1 Tax=Ladona fulva TaxID=123851 RepID=A0A8K0P5I5_LADFU|nr:hypothetical protein J437_LFUL019170 [Ladona fulva]